MPEPLSFLSLYYRNEKISMIFQVLGCRWRKIIEPALGSWRRGGLINGLENRTRTAARSICSFKSRSGSFGKSCRGDQRCRVAYTDSRGETGDFGIHLVRTLDSQKKILKIPWFTVNGSAPRGGHGGSFPRWAALSFDRKTSSGRLSEIATGDYYRRLPQTSRLLIKFIKLKSVDLIILITNSCLLHFTLPCVSFCLLASLLCK